MHSEAVPIPSTGRTGEEMGQDSLLRFSNASRTWSRPRRRRVDSKPSRYVHQRSRNSWPEDCMWIHAAVKQSGVGRSQSSYTAKLNARPIF